jgi:putative phosphoesterase
MKIGLLGDIHGNYYALKAVLNSIKKKNIDTLLIVGDFVGYYFWPVEVFELLKDWNMVAICGNHDRMLKDAANEENYRLKVRKKYGSGLDIALDQLDEKRIEWLNNLPDSVEYEVDYGSILLCHGSPWDGDEYVYPDSESESLRRYANLDVKWVVQGHTHYPMHKEIGDVTIINPGSVGQPRNRQLGAQWALLDTRLNKVDFYCEQYDIKIVTKESRERHPEIPYLANILEKL